ncbi:MAG: 3-dehydroquinate synthase [Pirellulaceae bacterium]|nr:3-dehydroquinate synthase [Pirellulaceae bacterium]
MTIPYSTKLTVSLAHHEYPILIGTDWLTHFLKIIRAQTSSKRFFLITDENVEPHAIRLQDLLHKEESFQTELLTIPAGEESKSITEATTLWNRLLDLGADRKSVILAVGGGVVGDLAGFIAATFGRGIPFIQIPSSLLAQVDSSVGGKVGINLPQAKNIVGAFWHPAAVLIDTTLLDTLPDREYAAGLAEVVKYGAILDLEFFEFLEQNIDKINQRDPETVRKLIARSCQLKAKVVQADEREKAGQRALLNYGHTFGHALEAITEYGTFLHGEAISIGMMSAIWLSKALGLIDGSELPRQQKLFESLHLPTCYPSDLDIDRFLNAMTYDKKRDHGTIHFVVLESLGKAQTSPVENLSLIRQAITNFLS